MELYKTVRTFYYLAAMVDSAAIEAVYGDSGRPAAKGPASGVLARPRSACERISVLRNKP
jgi:hypothetical protein